VFFLSSFCLYVYLRGEQKNRKTDLTEQTGKKLTEKTEPVKKKPIEPVKIFRKMSGSVRFPVLVCLNRPTRTGSG
jgi:hypothetical protein